MSVKTKYIKINNHEHVLLHHTNSAELLRNGNELRILSFRPSEKENTFTLKT